MTDLPPPTPPPGFVPWPHPSPVLDAIGGFWRSADDLLRAGFVVDRPKCNARGFLHAGVVATIADVTIGHALAASTEPPGRYVTVNLSSDLLGAAHLDEWVEVEVTPTRAGRRLAAGTATLRTSRVVATVTALFMAA